MAGRPSKLTEETAEKIVSLLAEGAYVETAAEAAGIGVSTLYLWLDRGANGEEPYAAFLESVVRARAEAEIDLMRSVRRGDAKGTGFGEAKAAAFLLERTRPNKFAQRVNVKVEEAISKVLEGVRRICSPEDFARVVAWCERVDSEGGEGDPGREPDEGPRATH
jgi:hypothetical protein